MMALTSQFSHFIVFALRLAAGTALLCAALVWLAQTTGRLMPGGVIALRATRFANVGAFADHIALLDVNEGLIFDTRASRLSGYGLEWSPDGEHIAYTIPGSTGISRIRIMSMNGSRLRWLVPRETHSQIYPRWSPDGTRISFLLSDNRNHWLHVADMSTGAVSRMGDIPARVSQPPVWSPDSRRIAFLAGDTILYLINADGTGLQPLVVIRSSAAPGYVASQLDWSPDGQHLLLSLSVNNALQQIYTLHVDTGELTRLTDFDYGANMPRWSPDGRFIAFLSHNFIGRSEIFVMDADGGSLRQLTFNTWNEGNLTWSPDGQHIAFTASEIDGISRLYLIHRDGSNLRPLAGIDLAGSMLAWRPG